MKRYRARVLAALLSGLVAIGAAPADKGMSGRLLDGTAFSTAAADGGVTVVNFWATWCVPCRAELPVLAAFYARHRGQGLRLVAVGLDAGGPAARLRVATAGLGLPVARLDDVRLARAAIPTALPETRVYGRDGALRYDSGRGRAMDEATLERVVAPLLAERAPTP